MDGGPGSGNFGHKGRPGMVGGSGGGGGSAFRTKSKESKSGYIGIQKAKAFKAIARSARSNKDYRKFVSSLSTEQMDQLRAQHKSCGTSENLTDYTKRLHAMLTATKGDLPKFNGVVEGNDISATYKWDGEPYTDPKTGQVIDEQIEDVIHKQGFDAAPKLVTQAEFDQIVKDHPEMPVLLRSYAAPDADTLQDYDDMLEGGAWYVDCGTGGAQYGQGMYCAGVYGEDKNLESALDEMNYYRKLNEQRCSSVSNAAAVRFDSMKSIPREMNMLRKVYRLESDPSSIPNDFSKIDPGDYVVAYKSGDSYVANPLTVEENGFMIDPSGFYDHNRLEQSISALRDNKDREARLIKVSKHDIPTPQSSTRMMTLDPSAKIITHQSLMDLKSTYVTGHTEYKGTKDQFVSEFGGVLLKNGVEKELARDISEAYYDVIRESGGDFGYSANEAYENARESLKLMKTAGVISEDDYYKNAKALRKFGEAVEEAEDTRFEIRDAHPQAWGMDPGVIATIYGYDAINASGHGPTNSYTVVLNRSKVILSEQRVRV